MTEGQRLPTLTFQGNKDSVFFQARSPPDEPGSPDALRRPEEEDDDMQIVSQHSFAPQPSVFVIQRCVERR